MEPFTTIGQVGANVRIELVLPSGKKTHTYIDYDIIRDINNPYFNTMLLKPEGYSFSDSGKIVINFKELLDGTPCTDAEAIKVLKNYFSHALFVKKMRQMGGNDYWDIMKIYDNEFRDACILTDKEMENYVIPHPCKYGTAKLEYNIIDVCKPDDPCRKCYWNRDCERYRRREAPYKEIDERRSAFRAARDMLTADGYTLCFAEFIDDVDRILNCYATPDYRTIAICRGKLTESTLQRYYSLYIDCTIFDKPEMMIRQFGRCPEMAEAIFQDIPRELLLDKLRVPKRKVRYFKEVPTFIEYYNYVCYNYEEKSNPRVEQLNKEYAYILSLVKEKEIKRRLTISNLLCGTDVRHGGKHGTWEWKYNDLGIVDLRMHLTRITKEYDKLMSTLH